MKGKLIRINLERTTTEQIERTVVEADSIVLSVPENVTPDQILQWYSERQDELDDDWEEVSADDEMIDSECEYTSPEIEEISAKDFEGTPMTLDLADFEEIDETATD